MPLTRTRFGPSCSSLIEGVRHAVWRDVPLGVAHFVDQWGCNGFSTVTSPPVPSCLVTQTFHQDRASQSDNRFRAISGTFLQWM